MIPQKSDPELSLKFGPPKKWPRTVIKISATKSGPDAPNQEVVQIHLPRMTN